LATISLPPLRRLREVAFSGRYVRKTLPFSFSFELKTLIEDDVKDNILT
jgi:hypothetical protein